MVTVAERMARNVVTIGPDEPLSKAVVLAETRKIRKLPVIEGIDRLVGIITDRDLKRAQPSPWLAHDPSRDKEILDRIPVSKAMTASVLTIHPDAPLTDAIRLLVEHRIGALPVVEEGCLVGILSETDVLRHCLEGMEE